MGRVEPEPTPHVLAFKVKRLLHDERAGLLRAGLSLEQDWAIRIVGLGPDELNELLIRGSRQELARNRRRGESRARNPNSGLHLRYLIPLLAPSRVIRDWPTNSGSCR